MKNLTFENWKRVHIRVIEVGFHIQYIYNFVEYIESNPILNSPYQYRPLNLDQTTNTNISTFLPRKSSPCCFQPAGEHLSHQDSAHNQKGAYSISQWIGRFPIPILCSYIVSVALHCVWCKSRPSYGASYI